MQLGNLELFVQLILHGFYRLCRLVTEQVLFASCILDVEFHAFHIERRSIFDATVGQGGAFSIKGQTVFILGNAMLLFSFCVSIASMGSTVKGSFLPSFVLT
jgi:hypothetical protein